MSATRPEAEPASPPPPGSLGRFELVHELGHGGMASVHLARIRGPADFTQWVAIKRIHPHLAKESRFIDMFLDEARIAASLSHPNVATVFELGEADGEYFIAMEYLHGEHLGKLAYAAMRDRGHLPYVLAARIVAYVADGLHHAHEATDPTGRPLHLVHRDVSPHNIFVTYDGQVKLTDFGIAKAAGRITHTATGHLKGKLSYMAPEQALAQAIDRRADVFSLGIVLWEATVGRRLFKAETDAQTLMRITAGRVPRPCSVHRDFPPALEAIVMKSLSLDPDRRYSTASSMARDLERFLADTGEPVGPSEIAPVMRALFPDRMIEKNSWLRVSSEDTSTTIPDMAEELPMRTSGGSEESGEFVTKAKQRTSPSRWIAAALGLAVLVSVGTFAAWPREQAPAIDEPGPRTRARIVSHPAGASVTIDGEEREGRTPVTLLGLTPGRHELTIELEGYQLIDTVFDAELGDPLPLQYELRPLEPEVVDLDDVEISASEDDLEAPEAPDAAEAPAARTGMRRRPRPQTEVTTEAASATATLTVFALPWARVQIDGRREQQTPLRGISLPAGSHTLRYRVQGEGDVRTMRVELEPGQTRTVRLVTQ